MSRVQLALNVSDLDEAIAFYSKLFGTEPAKLRPGLRQLRHRRSPAQAGADGGPEARGSGVAGALNHLGVEVGTTDEVSAATGRLSDDGTRHGDRGADDLLLRRPGQGVGERP